MARKSVDDSYKDGKTTSVRNSEGIWINSNVFREEAIHFIKHGYYCPDPWGSPAWMDYWTEQRKRCIKGYTVGGVTVTGEHYFYLNFCPIQKVTEIIGKTAKKEYLPPDFWDGDYNYFWAREIARNGVLPMLGHSMEKTYSELELAEIYNKLMLQVKIPSTHLLGGYNMIVGKSRRRGYSYKAGSIATKNFYTKPKSLTILGAYDKKYLYPGVGALFSIAKDNINFINNHTGWRTPAEEVDRQDQIKASYLTYKNGNKTYEGLMSSILCLSYGDNPDVARGKDAYDVFFEESGAFGAPGLLTQSYRATEDCVKASDLKTGLITLFGTSGDLESGTYDYADMFNRPTAFDLLPFYNIWDNGMSETFCGFWHGANQNAEGFFDSMGNSDIIKATESILNHREYKLKAGATSTEIAKMLQERPLSPSEAFASASLNNYPVVELNKQLTRVKTMGLQLKKGTPVELSQEDGIVTGKPILHGDIAPITSFRDIPTNKNGVVIIYERPIANAPKGLYKIGYDPVRQDDGTSLAAIIVYKGVHKFTATHDIIVAEYVGRRETTDDIDRVAELLAMYYNTTIMHENEVTGVKNYFRRIKRLDLLAHQPDAVISKSVRTSTVARVYGCHMNQQLKDAGERYIKDWLLTILDYDENGNPIRVYDRIYSQRLLEELIAYHRKGNFDLHSALIMCLFQVQEEAIGKVYSEKKEHNTAKKLLEMLGDMYKK